VRTNELAYFETLLKSECDDAALFHEEKRLVAAEKALETLHDDPAHYGLCVICGRPIDSDRLRIVPATRYCEDDAERRPAAVIGPRNTSVGRAPRG
jgi:RNA polymerase-binding transcription factor DksA